ncbi:hypothetical protein BGX38DRAFT_1164440 [Terfezia claveryi]|nr:hypothetical protein BGX38DRAFT_1164440 [Terfezia claveryi]
MWSYIAYRRTRAARGHLLPDYHDRSRAAMSKLTRQRADQQRAIYFFSPDPLQGRK